MKSFPFLAIVTILWWTPSNARAQSELSWAPKVVRLPPVEWEQQGEHNITERETGSPREVLPTQYIAPAGKSFSDKNFAPYSQNSPGYVDQAVRPQVRRPIDVASLAHREQSSQEGVPKRRLRLEYAPGLEPWVAQDVVGDIWHGYGAAEADWQGAGLADPQPRWYASVAGLIMARGDKPNKVWVTHEAGNIVNPLMHTRQELDWRGGGEIRFGRRVGPGGWAIEAGYWTLDPFTSVASRTHPNLVSTPLDFTDVDWADPVLPGSPGALFDAAEEHRVWRRNEVHNVDLALFRHPLDDLCRGPFEVGWLIGARYFRFEEGLRFGSMDQNGIAFGVDPVMEGYLDDKIINHLVGFQLGSRVDYYRDRWRLYLFPKVGIYNNHIKHRFTAYRGDGELFAPVPAGYPSYPVSSTRDVFSLLTEVDLGLEWRFAAKWSASIGYRATIASGMGLADHQIPLNVADTPDLADIDSHGYLLLHGGYATATCRF